MLHFGSSDQHSPPLLKQFNNYLGILFVFLLPTSSLLAQATFNLTGKSLSISNGQSVTSVNDNTQFSNLAVCNGSIGHLFTISNTGTSPLIISSISSSLTAFSLGNIPSSINPGQNADFSLYFDPATIDTFRSTITIINNDLSQDPFSFEVEGLGIGPQTDIVRGNALRLDGNDDYIDCSTSLNAAINHQTECTLEAWFKIDDTMPEQVLFSNTVTGIAEGLELRVQSGNIWLSYRDNNGSLNSSPVMAIDADTWYHVAGIINADSIGIYLNGKFEYNSIVNTGILPSVHSFLIGSNNSLGTFNFGGSLDELRLWSDCRSNHELREKMHLNLTGCEDNLVAYYQCNASSGTVLENNLGSSHPGNLLNGPQWQNSTINVGNDASASSISETIASVPQGTSNQIFGQANVSMSIVQHSGIEDITISYQAFAPNSTSGSNGFINFDNAIWTINSSKQETLVADYIFSFPSNTFSYLTASKYALYWRPMNSPAEWTKIAIATAVTDNSIRFGKIGAIGQFMVVQESSNQTTEVRGNMIVLDGTDDYIDAGNHASLDLNDNFSLESWFKTSTISATEKVIMAKELSMYNEGFVLSVVNNDIQFYFPNMGQLSFTGVVQNEWHHVAVTFNYGTISLYLDGVEVASGFMEFINNSTENFYIGAAHLNNGGGSNHYFEGAIDEVRIWSSTRSQAQIRENMHLTLRGTESDLISYYQFNNDLAPGSSNGVIDAMNQNNATNYGMTSSNYSSSEVAVGGGLSDRITVAASGPNSYSLSNSDIELTFGTTTPDGEIVVYRIESEKPHGWNSIAGDVDNEYFIVENFGNNISFSTITDLSFNRIGYISEDDVALPQASSPLLLYKRGDNDYGPTWGNSRGGAAAATAGSCGSVQFDNNTNLTSFSQFVVVNVNNNSLLPLELIAFDAKRVDPRNVALNWTIAAKQLVENFEIEVMYTGQASFSSIASVAHRAGGASQIDYSYSHPNSQLEVSYYRLKLIDSNGKLSYSPIRAVGNSSASFTESTLQIYPSPVDKRLHVVLPSYLENQKVGLKIVDLQGKTIWSKEQQTNASGLVEISDVAQLNPAVYILVVQTAGQRICRKFIKK